MRIMTRSQVGSGADDNASGVGVMLEAASLIQGTQTPYSVRFIAFGAEEIDKKGSLYYVDHLSPSELAEYPGHDQPG